MSYLNKEGLEHLWQHILLRFNRATSEDIVAMMQDLDVLPSITDESGAIFTDETGAILLI